MMKDEYYKIRNWVCVNNDNLNFLKKMRTATKLFSVAIISLIFGEYIAAQECEAWYPMKEGAYLEMKNCNSKGQLMGCSVLTDFKE